MDGQGAVCEKQIKNLGPTGDRLFWGSPPTKKEGVYRPYHKKDQRVFGKKGQQKKARKNKKTNGRGERD